MGGEELREGAKVFLLIALVLLAMVVLIWGLVVGSLWLVELGERVVPENQIHKEAPDEA